jgi:signal transduction histidine kinase
VANDIIRTPDAAPFAATALAAAIAMAIGALVVAGWALDAPLLKSVLPGRVAMQPVTALALILSGGALLAAHRAAPPILVKVAGAVVMLLAGQALLQFLTRADFGTDYLLFGDAVALQQGGVIHPGRMAEPTAFSFLLAGVALLLAHARSRTSAILFSAFATTMLIAISLTLFGYLLEAPPLSGMFGFTPVALPTALGIGALAIGLLALRRDAGWVHFLQGETVGAAAARSLLPVVVLVPILVSWLAFEGAEAGLYQPEMRLAILTSMSIGLLGWITIWTATRLNRLDAIRRAEQALRESERRLAQSQAELLHVSRVAEQGVMGSTLAHELNQPLTAAANYISAGQHHLALRTQPSLRELKRMLIHAQASVKQASEIIRRLRAYVSKGTVEREAHDLHKIIEDSFILAVAGRVLDGAGTNFQFDRAVRWVKVDPIQIQQVLINLVRNAVDAMAGAERREIIVSTRRLNGSMAEVSVSDLGPGFPGGPPEDLFFPFNAKGRGMGLGLSISRTIVEAHGGRIWAEDGETGAVFRFTLPLAVMSLAETERASAAA